MSLRKKLLVIMAAVAVVFLASLQAIQEAVIRPAFSGLEDDLARSNLTRVREALQKEVHHLDAFATDWGAWDDTCKFLADTNAAYVDANLTKDYFVSGNFDAAYYVALDGTIVWHGARDPERDYEETSVPTLTAALRSPGLLLLANREPRQGTAGLLDTAQGPMMVASRPIITSTKEGPLRGWLVLGKWLTKQRMASLGEQTKVPFELRPIGSGVPAGATTTHTDGRGQTNLIVRVDDQQLCILGDLADFAGAPLRQLRIAMERSVHTQAETTLSFASWSTLGATALLLLLLFALLQRFVLSPVAELTSHATAIGAQDDLLARLNSPRRDEFGALARQFDHMVDRLAESRTQLLEAARDGGRSEIATSVLHNVGNVLNSVNVAKDLLQQKLGQIDERTLDRLLDLLLAHQNDLPTFISEDPAGRNLPRFLQTLVRSLGQTQRAAKTELEQLGQGIEHLRTLVAAQQEYAGAKGVEEFVAPGDLLEQAIRMSAPSEAARSVVALDLEPGLPLFKLHKHKVLEALVNLLRNANEAVASRPAAEQRIVVRLRRSDGQRLRVEVEDNGRGISAEHLPKLFQFGFTTKSQGHGFGLHASANTIREIGGEIAAASDGEGKGATFTLSMPYAAVAAAPAEAR